MPKTRRKVQHGSASRLLTLLLIVVAVPALLTLVYRVAVGSLVEMTTGVTPGGATGVVTQMSRRALQPYADETVRQTARIFANSYIHDWKIKASEELRCQPYIDWINEEARKRPYYLPPAA